MRGARRFWRQGPRARGRCLGFFELSQLHMSPYGDHGVVEGMGHGKILRLCQGQLKFLFGGQCVQWSNPRAEGRTA